MRWNWAYLYYYIMRLHAVDNGSETQSCHIRSKISSLAHRQKYIAIKDVNKQKQIPQFIVWSAYKIRLFRIRWQSSLGFQHVIGLIYGYVFFPTNDRIDDGPLISGQWTQSNSEMIRLKSSGLSQGKYNIVTSDIIGVTQTWV